MNLETIFITNIPGRAQAAQIAGVDKIMVDLEILGKVDRQGHLDTVISRHTLQDVTRLRPYLSTASLMVRVNPINDHSAQEIDATIAAGADTIMLPMFSSAEEAREFIAIVNGRARTCLLFETAGSLENIQDVVVLHGIDEVHIGLNDLHLSLGLTFMFELLSGGTVEYMADVFRRRGLKFGIGGVARLGRGMLPAELILSEHVRLGSSQVILSRDYANIFEEYPLPQTEQLFRQELLRFRKYVQQLHQLSAEQLSLNSAVLTETVNAIVASRRSATQQDRTPQPQSL